MARFKRRSRSRGGFRTMRHSRRSSGSSLSPMGIMLPAAVYGVGRDYLANAISPLTSKIPLGGYADEIGMGILGYLAAKKGKGMVKQLGMAALFYESANIGKGLAGGMLGTSSGSTGGW